MSNVGPSVVMDVRVDAEQSTATARGVADPVDTLEPRQDQSDNEGQDQDLRNAPFACNVCKRSYSRVDHLARHHRSHTQEKPFPCEICGKTFARADLVKRHAACHSEAPSKKRKRRSSLSGRTSVACTACAAAKIRCENDKPCLRCVKKGITCVPVNEDIAAPQSSADFEAGAIQAGPSSHSLTLSPVRVQADMQSNQDLQEITPYAGQISNRSPREVSESHPYPNFDEMQTNNVVPERIEVLPLNSFETVLPSVDFRPDESFMLDGVHLGDFLADVMMSVSPQQLDMGSIGGHNTDIPMRDVFDFGIENDFDLTAIDLQLLSQPIVPYSPKHLPTAADENNGPPSRAEYINGPGIDPIVVEAFQKSLWRWTPGRTDQAHCEQSNLSLPNNIGAPNSPTSRPHVEALTQLARDKILAMILDTCERDAIPHIVTSFPSAELLDHLMQESMYHHDRESNPFVHIPTFRPRDMHAELVASIVFFGAVRSPMLLIRKLGFALQESVRLALPKAFERDNSTTRNLQMLQAYLLQLRLGLWSGNRRKMEIAESHGLPLITMLRRSGRFKRPRQSSSPPTLEDSLAVLDTKWQAWIEAESFKRLAYSVALHDAELSMSFHVPPSIKHGEMSLDLPASEALWKAKTASAWRDVYLTHGTQKDRGAPAAIACLHTAHEMLNAQDRIDLGFSVKLVLSMFWKVIWDARQLQAATKPYSGQSATTSLTSGHWQHELSQTLRNFCMIVGEAETFTSGANLLHEYLHLNIYVSFDELSLFAGKEGHREARRVYTSLKQWADSRDSRQALWHAGQVVREATMFAPGTLFGFYAIALYHAGLTLWAYGLLTKGVRQVQNQAGALGANSSHQGSHVDPTSIIFLDGMESVDMQKFVALSRATPVIRRRDTSSQNADADPVVYLDDPKAVMSTIAAILRDHFQNLEILPTLVENLIHLMDDLGKVATTRTAKKF